MCAESRISNVSLAILPRFSTLFVPPGQLIEIYFTVPDKTGVLVVNGCKEQGSVTCSKTNFITYSTDVACKKIIIDGSVDTLHVHLSRMEDE